MSFRFVLGRAGSGKTRYCLEAVATELRRSADGPPLILLVPEQATFQTDRALVTQPGVRGAARAEVLSFRRLAWRVLAQTGGSARHHIDEVGKAMALRVLLARRRGELRVFGSISARAGFLGRLARTLTELHSYGIRHPELAQGYGSLEALGRGETFLAGKLHDLAIISRDLEEYLAGRWVDPDDYLTLLAEKLAARPAGLAGARVWVDGFAGFTRQEFGVLRSLTTAVDEITVALCLDPANLDAPRDGSSTFHPTLRTYDALLTLVAETVGRAETSSLEGQFRFVATPALAHLEREYPNLPPRPYSGPATRAQAGPDTGDSPGAGSGPAPDPGSAPDPQITLVAAESRRAEVAAVAREIVRLARDEGYRWREMSLVTRSLDPYADLLRSTFADHGIPYFIDSRRSVTYHPLVEFAHSAVEVALSNWAAEPVFRLLKSDLWPLSRDEVDLLENYVLAHGVRGLAWTDERSWSWRRVFALDETAPPDPAADAILGRIDTIRREVAALLGPFVATLARPSAATPTPSTAGAPPASERPRAGRLLSVRDLAGALWNLVAAAGVPATLDRWRLLARAAGEPVRAQEHEQVLAGLVSLLDQMEANLGDHSITLPEFARILEAGLETLTLGLVPPSLDQVTVGAIDRSRQPDVKACFVIGANDGVFPATNAEDIVFSDRERAELGEVGLELAPSSRERTFGEDYLAYIALTRSSERLWVSYALSGDDGRALSPSTIVSRLRAAFPGLKESPAFLEPRAEEVSAETEALSGVVKALASLGRGRTTTPATASGPAWFEVYNWLVAEPGRRERAAAALRSLGYANRPAPLPEPLAKALYGYPVAVSVSKLEDYAGCPFRHFASAGLALAPRPRQQLKAPEIGRYYHAVLSVFTRNLAVERLDLADLDSDSVAGHLARAVAEVTPRLESEVLLSSARNRHLADRLRRTVSRTIELLGEHARRGVFRPVGAELRFVFDPAEGGVRLALRGVIDRLETASLGPARYVRVIDFKSGGRDFRVQGTHSGLDLQLPAYLLAAISLPPGVEGLTAAGAFFFPVTDPFVSARGPLGDDELSHERMKATRVRGVALADPGVLGLMDRGLGGWASGAPLLPFGFNRDGSLRKSKALLSPGKIDLLLDFTRVKLKSLAAEVLSGRIDVRPAREPDGATACRFCEYRPVCRFDPGAGDFYHRLSRMKEEAIWERMVREVESSSDGGQA